MADPDLRSGTQGPFRPDQVRPGEPYELSHGHPMLYGPDRWAWLRHGG